MSTLAIVLIIVGIILFLPSLFVAALKFLLYAGLILIIAGAAVWLAKTLRGKNNSEL